MPALVAAVSLTKRFGDLTAVDGIDFRVEEGETFGFLGPNGAGKSSTMRMIASVSPPSDGNLAVFGLNPVTEGRRIRSRLGVVPQENTLDMELTVEENLMIYGRYFNLPRAEIRRRIDDLLDFAQLSDRRGSKVEPLSGGMKRRLTIARGLINRPDLLILDEPATGLDPQARHLLWERLYRLKREGVTLIVTTHYMDEAEQLCDRLVIMDRGKIVAEGSPEALIAAHATPDVVEMRFDRPVTGLEHAAQRVETLPDRTLLYTRDVDATLAAVHDTGLSPLTTLVRRSTLEDVFLHLTGRQLVD